ncbi:MAG: hypothetical protein M1817_006049 [Caeruleum heppii]|nr:MAG: hypothetical protein M1817_006049 [Caeruleum heppii]
MSRPTNTRTASTNLGLHAQIRRLEGKLAIVTGASRGIGAATARLLAGKGCSIVLNYTSDSSTSRTEALADELQSSHNVNAIAVQADMGSPSGPQHIINTAKNHFSHPKTHAFRLDIIVNNAGLANNTPLADVKVETFHELYNVNVLGPLLLTQAALPYLPHDRSGRIVNVSSISASVGLPEQSVYGGTKAAVEAMTRTWSRELAPRATVNAVNPGPVATDMYGATSDDFQQVMRPFLENTPLAAVTEERDGKEMVERVKTIGGRSASEDEVAGVIGMLCGEDSAWCTGSVVCANGGMKFST